MPSSGLLPSPNLPIYIPGRRRMCSFQSRVLTLSSLYSNKLVFSAIIGSVHRECVLLKINPSPVHGLMMGVLRRTGVRLLAGQGSARLQYTQTDSETAYFDFYMLWIFPPSYFRTKYSPAASNGN